VQVSRARRRTRDAVCNPGKERLVVLEVSAVTIIIIVVLVVIVLAVLGRGRFM
jgi:hypothetical protein